MKQLHTYILFISAVLQIGMITGFSLVKDFTHSRTKVCKKIVSYRATRNVPYTETYRERTWGLFYKTKYRWNDRIEYFTSWRTDYTCCNGYVQMTQNVGSFECEPICQPVCGQGTCIKPNVCICYPGYAEEKSIGYFDPVCVPVCSRTCVHGKCTAPDNCTCDNGYSLSTDGYTCEPVCVVPCGAGAYCSKPGVCSCLPGYIDMIMHNRSCIPICYAECVNGKCTAPDVCTCYDGYEPENLFVCKPKCEHGCLHGKCTAPNVCTCDTGYSLKNSSVCEPVCSQACVMGTCVAPESCSCSAGYGLLEDSKYICEPFCEKACLNGKCTAPDVCSCNKGFQKSNNVQWAKHICEPYCEIQCEPFGTCTAPNVCTCFDGYRLVDKNQTTETKIRYAIDASVCKPICQMRCINGFCSNPNTCTCNDGYYPSDGVNTALCLPRCQQKCVNGFCSAPDTCVCKTGYRLSKGDQSNICKPLCKEDCVNGYCSAPNVCSCNVGYRPQLSMDGINSTNVCQPVCEPSCRNAVCILPNLCNCNPGYRFSQNSTNVCDPVCHPACEPHGRCIGPDSCVCENGYRMVQYNDVNVPFGCEPICSIECGNGTCTAPEVCTCNDDYRNAETGRCVPVCSACGNGTCVAPEVCECDDGFSLMDIKVPDFHVALDKNESENRTNGNGSRCVPRCEICDNGECVAPNQCQCHTGYVKIKDTCVYACHKDCGARGECIEEHGICECHYGWTGPYCNRPSLCILSVNDEENRTESISIMEKQNATIEYVLLNNPACPDECVDEIGNETLCFNMHNSTDDEQLQIGCLMDGECFRLSSKYDSQKGIVKLNAIAGVIGLLFLIGAIIAAYAIVQKRRSRQQINLDNTHRTSIQELTGEHAVDSE